MAGKFWARCGGQGRGAKKKLDYFHTLGSIATDCWFLATNLPMLKTFLATNSWSSTLATDRWCLRRVAKTQPWCSGCGRHTENLEKRVVG
jgi:hypothetical protein